ncbi:MAG: transglycosylase SLT domain-containing protein [Alphaproteobacteria bacterium]|nr:transglycosylase SLT domain-containing protein [Alphaproteobacteria bacterium]
MDYSINALEIKALGKNNQLNSNPVIAAIQTASTKSGVDFSYLVKQAKVESNFDNNAKAKTSSATGLYQFLDKTWMSMIDRHGETYGLETEGLSKKEILEMRKDPQAASFMAAAFASENEQFLNRHWGGDIGDTELYLAHFLGASGAATFLNASDENPLQPAADIFPKAALANRNVFYNKETGEPRTLHEVYSFFAKKFEGKTPLPRNDNIAITQNSGMNYSPSKRLSGNLVMQRADAMRQKALLNMVQTLDHGQIRQNILGGAHKTKSSQPFYSLLAKPVDLIMLTQNIDKDIDGA